MKKLAIGMGEGHTGVTVPGRAKSERIMVEDEVSIAAKDDANRRKEG